MTRNKKNPKNHTETNLPVVFLLLDVSGSMVGESLQRAIKGCVNFARKTIAAGCRLGFLTFGSFSFLRAQPTRDLVLLRSYMVEIEAEGSTNMAAGLFDAYMSLRPNANTPASLFTCFNHPLALG